MDIVICPGCGENVPHNNNGCPHCGYQNGWNGADGRLMTLRELLAAPSYPERGALEMNQVCPAFLRRIAEEAAKAHNAGAGRLIECADDGAPHVDDAYYIGATGGQETEGERLAFESWMRGHCWALCATWTGRQYRSDAEQGGDVDPRAMRTRQLWAAWRDRATLARLKTPGAGHIKAAPEKD